MTSKKLSTPMPEKPAKVVSVECVKLGCLTCGQPCTGGEQESS